MSQKVRGTGKVFAQDGRQPLAMTPIDERGRQPVAMTPLPVNEQQYQPAPTSQAAVPPPRGGQNQKK